MSTKIRPSIILLAIAALAVLLAAGGSWYYQKWADKKMMKVSLGLAEPSFPYRDRTQEELNKLFPQTKYADVATRVTPEQTYAKFRQGLKENNLEMALEQLDKGAKGYQENVGDLTKAYGEERFGEIYRRYSEKIEKVSMAESIAQYSFVYEEDGEENTHFINFSKNKNGDWKMKSL